MAATRTKRSAKGLRILYRSLPTERHHPAARRLDCLNTLAVLKVMNREDSIVARAVGRELKAVARAVDLVAGALKSGGRLFFFGAGTSGRLGVMEAAECPPTFSVPPRLVQAVMAGGRRAVFKSQEGAEDQAGQGELEALRRLAPGDVAVGIAASGVTPFVRGALRAARCQGCRTVLVTANARPLISGADVIIAPSVGPEILSGSTRLKSATAAKMVLNMLTTSAMIRLGKVYDHWMVDLRAASMKLRQRALRMVCELGRVSPARARTLFEAAGGSVKAAVLMARRNISLIEARRRLKRCGGFLRRALEERA